MRIGGERWVISFVYLSTCLLVYLSIHLSLSICSPPCLAVYLSTKNMFIHLPMYVIHLFPYTLIRYSINLSVHLSVYVTIRLSTYLCPSIHLLFSLCRCCTAFSFHSSFLLLDPSLLRCSALSFPHAGKLVQLGKINQRCQEVCSCL